MDQPITYQSSLIAPAISRNLSGYSLTESSIQKILHHICYTGLLLADYFTCLGIVDAAVMRRTSNETQFTLACARHKCSCSARDVQLPRDSEIQTLADYTEYMNTRGPDVFANMTSTITISGQLWELPAPPLAIGLAGYMAGQFGGRNFSTTKTSMDYSARSEQDESLPVFSGNNRFAVWNTAYWNNGTAFDRSHYQAHWPLHFRRCLLVGLLMLAFAHFLLFHNSFRFRFDPVTDQRLLEQSIRSLPPVALHIYRCALPCRLIKSLVRR
jgi:hypothetical protein